MNFKKTYYTIFWQALAISVGRSHAVGGFANVQVKHMAVCIKM
jgi:hypothetical protein